MVPNCAKQQYIIIRNSMSHTKREFLQLFLKILLMICWTCTVRKERKLQFNFLPTNTIKKPTVNFSKYRLSWFAFYTANLHIIICKTFTFTHRYIDKSKFGTRPRYIHWKILRQIECICHYKTNEILVLK